MFFGLRTNYALAILGVDPTGVDAATKHYAMLIGKAQGQTPQEVALILAAAMPPHLTAATKEIAAADWAVARKIDLDDEEVRGALFDLGWPDVLLLRYR